MGQLHNELRRGPLSRAMSAAVGDSRYAGGIERYGETLTPTMNLWERAEWAWLRREGLWSCFTAVAGVAAEQGFIGVSNPAGSDVIAVVTAANVRSSGAAPADVSLVLVDAATVAATAAVSVRFIQRDTRAYRGGAVGSVGNVQALLRVSGTDPAALGSIMETIRPTTVDEYGVPISLPFVLVPGYALLFDHNTVNVAMAANFAGYVRTAHSGELE